MSIKSKLAIIAAAGILGGTGFVTAMSGSSLLSNDNGVQTPAQTTATEQGTTPDNQSVANSVDNPSGTTSSDVEVTPDPTPVPKPQPKPATVYSSQPSAQTPCRLHDQNVYTNDCSADTPTTSQQSQSTATSGQEEPQQPTGDPSAVSVHNDN